MEETRQQRTCAAQGGLRVLVVVDDPSQRKEIARQLEGAGYAVETAPGAAQALEKSEGFRPQIVLADGHRDGMDGVALCRALRRQKNARAPHFVLLTSDDGEDALAQAFDAGVDDIIAKPVTPRVLLARLQGGARLIRLQMELEGARREQAEHARLMQQIQQAHKMQAIGKLTGGIAHNFNNHLAAILGYAELAQEMFPDVGDGQLAEFLQCIHQAGSEARNLVVSLRAFSQGGGDGRETTLKGAMLADVVGLLRPILSASIQLGTDFDEDIPLVLVNEEQVHQMVMNLCINAREAINGSGEIRLALKRAQGVRADCSSCHEWLGGEYLELSVRDTGKGMAADTIERVFDPFYSTKEVGQGTGLGLSIVHGIMHGYGGHVLVESAPGEGSNFRLLFPLGRGVPDGKAGEMRREGR